jgi:ABC transporter DrrB family efflux protein
MTAAPLTPDMATGAGPLTAEPGDRSRLAWAISDTLVVTKRNLLRLVRVPQLLVFTFIQPVLFTLMFVYVFGGSINTGAVPYVDYLMPGIFVQTVIFGATSTGVGLAEDISSGLVDRFRSLPMARLAVLTGRTLADLARNAFVVFLMTVVGLMVGFRPHGGIGGYLFGVLLVLGLAFGLSWIFAIVGLRSSNAEAAQAVTFPIILPLTFASSAFAPVSNMPGWLQVFAQHQPVTIIINAARCVILGPADAATLRAQGFLTQSTASYVIQAILWIIVILGVAAPAAVRMYRKTV